MNPVGLARKDPLQTFPVESLSPLPAGAWAEGTSSPECRTTSKAPPPTNTSKKEVVPGKALLLSPFPKPRLPLQMLPWGEGGNRNTWEEPLHTNKSAPTPFDVDTPLSPRSVPGRQLVIWGSEGTQTSLMSEVWGRGRGDVL